MYCFRDSCLALNNGFPRYYRVSYLQHTLYSNGRKSYVQDHARCIMITRRESYLDQHTIFIHLTKK